MSTPRLKPTSSESPISFHKYCPHSSEYKHIYSPTHATEGTLTLEQMGSWSRQVQILALLLSVDGGQSPDLSET